MTNWRKSTYSRAHQNCVEAAAGHALVAARDSQDPDGPVIEIDPRAWTEFTTHVKHATSRGPGRWIGVPGISGAECGRS